MVLGMCNMTVGGVKGGFVEVFSSESLLCIAWHFLDLIIKIKKDCMESLDCRSLYSSNG